MKSHCTWFYVNELHSEMYLHMVTNPKKSEFMTTCIVVHMLSFYPLWITWIIPHIFARFQQTFTNSCCAHVQCFVWIGLLSALVQMFSINPLLWIYKIIVMQEQDIFCGNIAAQHSVVLPRYPEASRRKTSSQKKRERERDRNLFPTFSAVEETLLLF